MYGLAAFTDPSRHRLEVRPARLDDNLLPFSFPAVGRTKISAAFDGGRIVSDGDVMLLGQAERRLSVASKLAPVVADPRNPLLITHSLGGIFRARILAIACGYEDADDLGRLPFELACGRPPDTGDDLCSPPTASRWENAPSLRDLVQLCGLQVELYCASYAKPHRAHARHRLSAGLDCSGPESFSRQARDGEAGKASPPSIHRPATSTLSNVPIDAAKTRIAQSRRESGRV